MAEQLAVASRLRQRDLDAESPASDRNTFELAVFSNDVEPVAIWHAHCFVRRQENAVKKPKCPPRKRPTPPAHRPTRDNLDRSPEGAVDHARRAMAPPPADAPPLRHTVDSRRR